MEPKPQPQRQPGSVAHRRDGRGVLACRFRSNGLVGRVGRRQGERVCVDFGHTQKAVRPVFLQWVSEEKCDLGRRASSSLQAWFKTCY